MHALSYIWRSETTAKELDLFWSMHINLEWGFNILNQWLESQTNICFLAPSSVRKLKANDILRVSLTLIGMVPEEWLYGCTADFMDYLCSMMCTTTTFAFKDPFLLSSACADCMSWAAQCSLLLFCLNGFWKTSVYHVVINFSSPT